MPAPPSRFGFGRARVHGSQRSAASFPSAGRIGPWTLPHGKWQRADVGGNAGGDAKAAYAAVTAKVLLLPIATDLIFPVATCREEAALIPGARVTVIAGNAGHLGLFAVEADYMPQINAALGGLLAEAA